MLPEAICTLTRAAPLTSKKVTRQGGSFAELPSSSSSCFPLLKFSFLACGSKRDTSVCWSAPASPGGWEERATPPREEGRPGSARALCTGQPHLPLHCMARCRFPYTLLVCEADRWVRRGSGWPKHSSGQGGEQEWGWAHSELGCGGPAPTGAFQHG